MSAPEPSHEALWLRRVRGDETQESLAADISKVTRWQIDRSRYSKYESGTLPMGRQTLAHFVDYWKTRGIEGPDRNPPAEPMDPTLALVAAITALVDELRQGRTVQVQQNAGVQALVELLGSRLPGAPIDAHVDGPRAETRP
jgi:hypothetical protein